MPESYSSYLKTEELLALQVPKSDEHDELLFVIVHQVYELWFKQLLHECDYLQQGFARGEETRVMHVLGRILRILKVMVSQVDVLETMTPLEFLSFRARLESASGFQSWQFRAFEFCLGLKAQAVVQRFDVGSTARRELEKRLAAPSLWDSFIDYLAQKGHALPAKSAPEYAEALEALLIRLYRTVPAIAELAERLVDLDEGVQEWRYRHVKMVERTIGMRGGTGGSKGVEYLATTLMRPAFPALWAIRAHF